MAAGDTYNASQYGSNLWDLRSKSAEIVHASWRTNIKLVWKLPQQTETCFIDKPFATDVTSPKTVKAAKFTLWPDLHRETLDQTWVLTSNI